MCWTSGASSLLLQEDIFGGEHISGQHGPVAWSVLVLLLARPVPISDMSRFQVDLPCLVLLFFSVPCLAIEDCTAVLVQTKSRLPNDFLISKAELDIKRSHDVFSLL